MLGSVGIPFLRETEKVWIWGRGKVWGALGRVEGGETTVRLLCMREKEKKKIRGQGPIQTLQ